MAIARTRSSQPLMLRRLFAGLRCLLAAVALVALLTDTLQAQSQWINPATGNFSDGGNWLGGVPNGVAFEVANGGTALVTLFQGTSTATISNNSTVQLVSGGSAELSVGANLLVGSTGRGTLILGNQTKLMTSSFYVSEAVSTFGVNPGSEGVLMSSGGNYTTGSIRNGEAGTGNLTLTAGSTISTGASYFGVQPSSFGAMELVDSSWTVEGGVLSYGALTIGQHGGGRLVASGSQVRVSDLTLAEFAGANATVNLTGGNVTASQDVFVGMNGTASFAANSGAVVQACDLFVGRNAGASGNATVSGGSLTLSQDLHVGALGTGTFTLQNGGSVSSDITNIGFGANAVGSMQVLSGNWTNSRAVFIGVSGNGSLHIGAAGKVFSESGYLGHDASGIGAVTIDGGSWTMSDTLLIGRNGTATLTATGGTIASKFGQLGLTAGSQGTASLSNATWNVAQTLQIGIAGNGALTLGTGANLSANAIQIAASGGVNGSLTVGNATITTINIIDSGGSASVSFSGSRLQLPTSPQVVDTDLIYGFAPGAVVIGSGGLTVDTRGGNAIIPDVLDGDGPLTKSGAGRLRLSATNLFTGGVVVEGGAVEITASGVLGTGMTTMGTGELRSTANVTLSDSNAGSPPSIAIAANQVATFSATTNQTFTVATGNFSIGAGAGFTSGSSGNNGTVVFAPTNLAIASSPGAVTVAAGRLQAGNSRLEQLTAAAGSTTVAAGATLDFQDQLSGSGGINALYGAGTVRTGSDGSKSLVVNSGNFSGDIAGEGGLVKQSTGTLVIGGNTSFTGDTTVNAGTLIVNGSLAFGLGDAQVNAGGTLGGNGTVNGVSLDGGTLSPGNSPGTITVGELLWTSGNILFELGPDAATSDLINAGAIQGFGTTYAFTFVDQGMVLYRPYTLIDFATSSNIGIGDFTFTNGGGFDGTFAYNGSMLQFTPVPEPSTIALCIGAALLGCFRQTVRRLRFLHRRV